MTALDLDSALTLLRTGEIEVQGRMVDASNATLYGAITADGVEAHCVYKPVAGERPLWDFPDGTLAGREVSAFLVSQAGGWGVVPPTVHRDGPFGPGMVQLWIEADATVELVDVVRRGALPRGWRAVLDARDAGGEAVLLAHADDERLRSMAVFDAVVNNADRKGGHILPTGSGPADPVHGVDHGICFNADEKLRTVLWGWAGQRLREEDREALVRVQEALDGPLGEALAGHLTRTEVAVTGRRVRRLLREGVMPMASESWPAIPWPAF
ncbi:putative repeat protein (TIGR03843 family) [Motilibacter rhizosphaerae]|uniref:Putative repeat protein (TIGR03843 family) n=1 Tax=Motilibacter rhizosphaerae TaxID=598652 RepID=A0A4Q7NAS9_9ACTN|nr:SCO1664 family protein [Motilibacter rhizosphaerae]RZS80052.1 putative repeat protein (TIGR03843 family) [Motilibacter rhizosphaerae]